ncbi:hypothetical protein [Phenylobacterium sp.]|uniref:hypothetical protein n=1 Tax=Phenylobacterium sp. TaxID=1871053 RepID=UPI0028111E67|nr:hypothetical protein [Phenylobacterium sp.]
MSEEPTVLNFGTEAARVRAQAFRDSERMNRELADAESLPRLRQKYVEAADAYARLAEAEERVMASKQKRGEEAAAGAAAAGGNLT